MNNLTSDELKAVIIENAKKSADNMRVVLEAAAMQWNITKEIKMKFAKKLVKEFEAKLRERGYCIEDAFKEDMPKEHDFIVIYKKSWRGCWGEYCVGNDWANMKKIYYGIQREYANAPAIKGLDGALSRTNPGWHCWDYYPNQYCFWDGAEMLTNMAIEAGIVSGEPSYPVAEEYIKPMIALIDKTEGIIDSYIAEKKKDDDNVPS